MRAGRPAGVPEDVSMKDRKPAVGEAEPPQPPSADEGTAAFPHPRRAKKYASSVDVGRLAGGAQSAVSLNYCGRPNVSEQTRARVLAAAVKLNYRPSLIPQIMLTHRSHLIAIVMGGFYNPFYTSVLEQFTVKLQETGHQVLLVHVDSGDALDAVIPKL